MEQYETLPIQVDFEVDETFDSDKFLKLNLRVMHDGLNAKNIVFSLDAIKNAEQSLYNSPILAKVIFDKKNQPQFSSHDKHIEKDYAGNIRLIYDEVAIGVIHESSKYEIKKEFNKNYAFAEGYIWKKYANYALDIINRDKDIKLSMEIKILDFYIDENTKNKVVKAFRYDGITLLGNSRTPGMANAQASAEFDCALPDKKQHMIELMDALKECIYEHNNENGVKGGIVNLETNEEIETGVNDSTPEKNEQNFEETNSNSESTIETETVEDVSTSISDENYELTVNETRKSMDKALGRLAAVLRKQENKYLYMWLNDFDSKYIYFNREIELDKGYDVNSYRRSYTIDSEGKVTISDDEVQTVVKILTKDEWDKLEKERESFDVQFEELKSFKESTLKTQRTNELNAIFEKFDTSLNGVEEYISLKENNLDFDLKTVEEKCYALVGKKNLQTNVDFDNEDSRLDIVVTGTDDEYEDESSPLFCGGILEKYYKK